MMTTYKCDDGNAEIEIDAESATAAAQEYVDRGDWAASNSTFWVTVYVTPQCMMCEGSGWIESDRDRITIAVEPEKPDCVGIEHEWERPFSILGGLKENPGVWGHGGGVVIHEICIHCGTERLTDTWAQNPVNGEQGLESVTYEEGKYVEEVKGL